MIRLTVRILGWLGTVLPLAMAGQGAAVAQALQMKPAATSPAVVGPASLKAMSQHPTEIYVVWPPVPTMPQSYRVTRVDRAGGPEQVIVEGPPTGFGLEGNSCVAASGFPNCFFVDRSVSTASVYSYRVRAVYPGSVVSPPSPPASARPVFLAPNNLRATTTAAPNSSVPSVTVTLRWDPVYGATGYAVAPKGLAPVMATSPSAQYTVPKAAGQVSVCVNSIYPHNLRDDSVRSCLSIQL